jgi:hypothetical protein
VKIATAAEIEALSSAQIRGSQEFGSFEGNLLTMSEIVHVQEARNQEHCHDNVECRDMRKISFNIRFAL